MQIKIKPPLRALGLMIVLAAIAGCTALPAPSPGVTAPAAAAPAPPDTPRPVTPPAPQVAETAAPEPEVPHYHATFQASPCPFPVPPDQVEGKTLECGYLIVPENRGDPKSRDIRIAVAIFRHPDGDPRPDPIIYLVGGPGGSILDIVARVGFEAQFGPMWAAGRDIILFDQRGVRYSQPALDCPAFEKLNTDLLDYEIDGQQLTPADRTARKVEAFRACAEELRKAADLSAYNSAENAADVNDLRVALGYDKVNLWGASYGTRVALGVMRDYPQGLRSAILEAIYPPEVDLYQGTPANFDRSLNLLLQECAADEACNTAYPDLRTVLFDTVEQLNRTPAAVEIIHPFRRERYPMALRGDDLLELLFRALYLAPVRPALPKMIYDASQGDFAGWLQVAREFLWRGELRSWGMYFSVLCHEEIPFGSAEAFAAEMARYPAYAGFFAGFEVGGLSDAVCPFWGAGQAEAAENEPISSDVPALVLTGMNDPITPPAWAEAVAQRLENGYLFVYPGAGHGVSTDECARNMMLAFLEDPAAAPDDACIAGIAVPPFIVPAPAAGIELVPFTSQEKGIRGLAPAGWKEIGPGAFARGSSALDQAALVHDAVPMDAKTLVGILARQLGLEAAPEPAGTRETKGLSWTLYAIQVQGVAVNVAVAEREGGTLVIMLQGTIDESEALYDTVFLPAVDALVTLE